ncbi:MAG: T9SS type A sorting domain-containing protein [Ignavibacteriales bacterium]|nr:T9SS type A sorting domain-containing protein [Ignavibacteriales bacterium]
MKKLLTLVLFLLIVGSSYAQKYVFQPCDNSVSSGWWDQDPTHFYNNQGSAVAKMDLSDYTADKKNGTASLKVDYNVGAGDGWGGYCVRVVVKPTAQIYNLSTATKFTFWYKVLTPIVLSTPGATYMEFKLCDIQDGKEDRFLRQLPIDLADASGTWKQATVDLNFGTDPTLSWSPQEQSGDGELQLDKINGMEMSVVYIVPGGPTNSPTAAGSILFDDFAVTGDAYAPPILSFANMASQFGLDDMGWAGDGKGALTLSDEATDKVEGTAGSLKFDYTCFASQDWGGFVAFDIPVTAPEKFVERTYLSLFIKNLKAVTTTVPKRAVMRIFLFEKSNGTDEEQWITKVPIDLTQVSDWTRYDLPLKQMTYSTDGDQYPPTGGWGLNPNGAKGDQTFNPDKMTKIRIEVLGVGVGPDAGVKGEKLIGTMLLGMMQQSGFQIFDIVAPLAPSVAIVPGTFSNLVTWTDLTDETTEKYNVYASKSFITNINAPGVEVVAFDVPRGTQVIEHLLRSPKTDRSSTVYYAVNAVDKAGNIGAVSSTSSVENMAKGIPTIPILTVPNWTADGDLKEWTNSGVTPFKLFPENGSAHIMTGFTVTNNADCSADMYLAMDNTYLYFAANVNDDIVYADDNQYMSTGYNWALDAVDIEIGLYNQEAKQHTSYKHGTKPDYHFRFNKVRARSDETGKDSLLLPGVNYYWQEKFPSGYVVEARLKISDIAALRRSPAGTLDSIYVKEGYKIPLDFVVGDNDGKNGTDLAGNREGQISWSPFNNDNGWNNPSKLMYTWLGNSDQITTDIEVELPFSYSLDQNYPNPFNPTTQIKYSIAKAGIVTLKIYDILGRQVADLVNKYQDAGKYSIDFNASRLASGVYVYRIESSSFTSVKKMMLIK